MTVSTSPARALHDILNSVASLLPDTDQTAYHAWMRVSGFAIESVDFARFHAEVIELLSEVEEAVRGLPEIQRGPYVDYLTSWWEALVLPRTDWAAPRHQLLEPSHLHLLGALAGVLEARALVTGLPNPDAAGTLRRAIVFLLSEVESDLDLPVTVREQIVADLRHVLYLLDNAELFGVDHAVTATEKVLGKVLVRATTSGSGKLKQLAIGLVAALAITAGASSDLETIVTNVKSTFGLTAEASTTAEHENVVQSVVVKVYNECVPKQIAVGPAEPTSEGGDEAVDAEIVEEG